MENGSERKNAAYRRMDERAVRAARVLERTKNRRAVAGALRSEAARLRELAQRPAGGFCVNPRSGGGGNRMEEAMLRLLEAEERWAAEAANLAREEGRVGSALAAMPARECLLLQLRWLRGLSWRAVAGRLYVSERTARRMQEPALIAFWEAYEGEGMRP